MNMRNLEVLGRDLDFYINYCVHQDAEEINRLNHANKALLYVMDLMSELELGDFIEARTGEVRI